MQDRNDDETREILRKAIEALKTLEEHPDGSLFESRTTETSENTEDSESTEASETSEDSENKEWKEGTEDSEGSEETENSEATENSEDTENSESSESSEDTENQEGLMSDIYAPLIRPPHPDDLDARVDFEEYRSRLRNLGHVLESRIRGT
jgi:hypothetical protein